MSYDVVIEQVKALPEQLLSSVSAFIKLLEADHVIAYFKCLTLPNFIH